MILNYILNLIIIIENIQLMNYCAHVCAVAKKLKFLDAPYIIEILEDGILFRKIKSSISWSTMVKEKVKFYFTFFFAIIINNFYQWLYIN